MVTAANIVPSIQTPDTQEFKETEKVQYKPAQVDLSEEEIQPEETDPEDIGQKIDLSGIGEWDPMIQQEACNLIHEYACIFTQNNLDLGKTSIVKHSIKLTDPVPFKEHYQCIPPGINEEVKMHILEMLDLGSI